ncbi:MAG: hypothetical protein HY239_11740, partial [Mycolicibacterium aromaticivorans]|nr:hypothetical protein [Mycolicibacterium aromaticivorans]
QEILLGVGGVRLLRALGIQPSTFHMNEGHAAFLTLELVREKLAAGKSFEEAQSVTRSECLFTTRISRIVVCRISEKPRTRQLSSSLHLVVSGCVATMISK